MKKNDCYNDNSNTITKLKKIKSKITLKKFEDHNDKSDSISNLSQINRN